MEDERWLTIPEAAAHYGISESALRNRMRHRKYAGTELRDGRRMIRVEGPPLVNDVTIHPVPQGGTLADLITAQERTNHLLEQLLAATHQPPARAGRRWKWPWTHDK